MKDLDRSCKSYLAHLTNAVQSRLENRVRDSRMNLQRVNVYRSDTFGWMSIILKLKKIPGSLQLWLDLFPNVGRPILSICYSHGDLNRVKKVAEAFTHHPHKEADLSTRQLGPWVNGSSVLKKSLQKQQFGKPLVESYQSNFLTVYFADHLRTGNPIPTQLIRKVAKLSERLFRSASSALEAQSARNLDYASFENRKTVALHLRRERSQKLALIAKTRDGFTCRICDFNFADTYGELGRGFAEAHHVIPLSTLKKRTMIRVKDLVAVCPNCHRMLHKMDGQTSDVKRLRQSVRRDK